jgi:hypothetical protein
LIAIQVVPQIATAMPNSCRLDIGSVDIGSVDSGNVDGGSVDSGTADVVNMNIARL